MPKKQWEKIEEEVDEAEIAERKRKLADIELREETGLTKEARELSAKELEKNRQDYFSEEEWQAYIKKIEKKKDNPLEESDTKELIEELEGEKEVLAQEVEDILGTQDSPQRALISLRWENLFKALREDKRISLEKEQLLEKEAELLQIINDAQNEGKLVRGKSAILKKVRERLVELVLEKETLLTSNPEAYFGIHLKKLKEYKEDLQRGGIVETEYVKEQAEDILTHLRANRPVFLYGHLGSGKTELAMHIAQKYIGKEALIISGSKHTTIAELYGHQVLAIDKINKEELDDFVQEVEVKFNEWVEKNPKATEGEKNRAHDRVLQIYLAQLKGGTISEFFLGPIYKAMAEGRPIIIDEMNTIPHEVLASLNHILTRQVGDKINIQQDTGKSVEVQEGYGVIMTGNLNQGQEKYIAREDMDPAFFSRLYKIEYDYLPQKTEGALLEEAGEGNELFHLVLAKIMDNKGNIEVPAGAVKKLWNLAKVARITQDVFAGREISNAFYFKEAGGRAVHYLLKEAVLSIRAMEHILDGWLKDDFKYELDYYIWKEFISQSTVASDKAYLYQLFKDMFNFFHSENWDQNPDYGSGGVVNIFDIQAPQNPSKEKEFFGPRNTVQFAHGKAPKRAEYPQLEQAQDEEQGQVRNTETLEDMQKAKNFTEKKLRNMGKEVDESFSIT